MKIEGQISDNPKCSDIYCPKVATKFYITKKDKMLPFCDEHWEFAIGLVNAIKSIPK